MKNLFLGMVTLFLIACGGGGSSSSGGSSNNVDPASVAGIYHGTENTYISYGSASGDISWPLTVSISASGSVQLLIDGASFGSGSLSGNKVAFKVPGGVLSIEGEPCTGVLIYTGTIAGNTISGDSEDEELTCKGYNVTYIGKWVAKR